MNGADTSWCKWVQVHPRFSDGHSNTHRLGFLATTIGTFANLCLGTTVLVVLTDSCDRCFWGLAHRSLCGSTVAGRVRGEEARGQEIQSEEVLEAENGTKYHPDQEMMRRNSVRREWPRWWCCHRVGTCPHLKVKFSAESLVRMTTDKSIKDVGHVKTSLKAHVSLLIFGVVHRKSFTNSLRDTE